MVSIITPVYNCEKYLKQCIESVLNQSFQSWELILIDDFSTDSSREIIKTYAHIDKRIRFYFFQENVGAGIARNKGIQMANKRFIAFLDSDDYWQENKLKKQIDFMLRNQISFSYSRYFLLNSKDIPSKIILSPIKVNAFKLTLNNYIKTLTAIYDTKDIGKIFMPEYRKRQDWGLWFNILKKTKVAYCLPEPLAFYRTSNASSLSKNKFLLIKENFNFYRFFLKKSIIISIIMMTSFIIVHFYYKVFRNEPI